MAKKKNEVVKINTKKVGLFLKDINEAERIYLGHVFNLSNSILRLIKKFDLTKKQVCEKYGIKPSKYNDFICGNWNYDLREMSLTNCWFIELETVALEDKAPFQIAGEKERRENRKKLIESENRKRLAESEKK